MSKIRSLQSALDNATGNVDSAETAPQHTQVIPPDKALKPPSRQGKKAITGYFDPAVSRQLKQLALDRNTTVQALLSEALNDLFTKYGKNPLA